MATRIAAAFAAALVPISLALSPQATRADSLSPSTSENGIVKVRSAYPVAETIDRLKRDVASKGIMFFFAVDQSTLAADAGIRPSPRLRKSGRGSHHDLSRFGIDWRSAFVVEDENGVVWAVYNDFDYIARRHGITDRGAAFAKASEVIASITSSVRD
jgi:uncharacterized protein (DUF302 family)